MSDDRNQRAAVRLIKTTSRRALTIPEIFAERHRRAHNAFRAEQLGGATCDNCAQSVSKDPKCGLCCGPIANTTRWEPLQNNSHTA